MQIAMKNAEAGVLLSVLPATIQALLPDGPFELHETAPEFNLYPPPTTFLPLGQLTT